MKRVEVLDLREIAIIGATLSGNKGAASMLQAGLELIPEHVDDAHFNVLSIYPGADRRLNRNDRVDVVQPSPGS